MLFTANEKYIVRVHLRPILLTLVKRTKTQLTFENKSGDKYVLRIAKPRVQIYDEEGIVDEYAQNKKLGMQVYGHDVADTGNVIAAERYLKSL